MFSNVHLSDKIKIHQALQESVLQVLPDLYHGEFSINQGKDYANKVRERMEDKFDEVSKDGQQEKMQVV